MTQNLGGHVSLLRLPWPPSPSPHNSELTFQRFLKRFFPYHTFLTSFLCVLPQLISLQPHRILAVHGRHKTHPASGPLHWITKFASFTHHSDGFSFCLFLVALSLCCCTRAFSSCIRRGLLFIATLGLLISVASFIAEHKL